MPTLPSAVAAIVLQPNGRIVTVGDATTGLNLRGNSPGFGLTRFIPSGAIDVTFGTHGGVLTNFSNSAATSAFAVAIQTNGDIVAAGEAGSNTNGQQTGSFALARYLSNGQLDTAFGTGGRVITRFGNTSAAYISAIALQTDGKILAVGSVNGGTVTVARYLGQ